MSDQAFLVGITIVSYCNTLWACWCEMQKGMEAKAWRDENTNLKMCNAGLTAANTALARRNEALQHELAQANTRNRNDEFDLIVSRYNHPTNPKGQQ